MRWPSYGDCTVFMIFLTDGRPESSGSPSVIVPPGSVGCGQGSREGRIAQAQADSGVHGDFLTHSTPRVSS